MEAIAHRWPEEGLTRVPYWVYSDRALYEAKQQGPGQVATVG